MSHLCGVLTLPALSTQSPALLAKVQNDDLSLKELANALKLDPGLTSRLLHVANSPFFGVSGQIACMEEAVMVLGMARTKSLVQVEVLRGVVNCPPWNQVDLKPFWRQSLVMAAICEHVARRIGAPASEAFSAGLFHAVGLLALLQQEPQRVLHLFSTCQDTPPCTTAQVVQCSEQAQLGAEVLHTWHFPDELMDAVAQQYDPPQQSTGILTRVLQQSHTLRRLMACKTDCSQTAPCPVDDDELDAARHAVQTLLTMLGEA